MISSARVDLEGEDVPGEHLLGEALEVAAGGGVGLVEADRLAEGGLAEAEHQQHAEPEAEQDRGDPLAASVSTSESLASTPTSMSTKRNSIMIAPV